MAKECTIFFQLSSVPFRGEEFKCSIWYLKEKKKQQQQENQIKRSDGSTLKDKNTAQAEQLSETETYTKDLGCILINIEVKMVRYK